MQRKKSLEVLSIRFQVLWQQSRPRSIARVVRMIKVLEWDEMEETEEKLIIANLLWLPWHPSPKSLCFKAASCSAQAHNIIFSVMKLYCQFGGTAEDPKSRILPIVTPPNVQYSPTMLNIACVSLLEEELSSKRLNKQAYSITVHNFES